VVGKSKIVWFLLGDPDLLRKPHFFWLRPPCFEFLSVDEAIPAIASLHFVEFPRDEEAPRELVP
jgi:hypothetical protein